MDRLLVVVALVACSHPAPRPEPVTEPTTGEAPAGGTASATATSTSTATSTTPDTTTTNTTTTTSTTTTTGSATAGSASAGSLVLAICPATYAEAAAGTCALASIGKLSCTYPDGACSCAAARPCSGVEMPYEEARKHPRPAWSCTPKVRPDGCLGNPPQIGSRCTKDAQECGYGSCGGEVLACRSGKWEMARMIPPPPAAHR